MARRGGLDSLLLVSYSIPIFSLTIFLILPVFNTLAVAFFKEGKLTLYWFKTLFSGYYFSLPKGDFYSIERFSGGEVIVMRGIDLGVIPNSIFVAISVTLLTTFLGTVIALINYRYDFRGKRLLKVLALVPILVTPFVSAYVIKRIFSEHGLLNFILYDLLGLLPFRIKIDGLIGIIVAQTMSYYPIVYLNVHSTLMKIDPALEEQAENLGAKGLQLIKEILLPLAFPGIAAGAILVFIFSLEDLAAPIVFHSDPLARKTISFQIFSRFTGQLGERSPEIAALSIFLLVIALLAFVWVRRYVGLRSYAMLFRGTPKAREPPTELKLIIYPLMFPVVLFTTLPQVGVFLLALSERWTSALPEGLTLSNLEAISGEIGKFVLNSVLYSSMAVILIVLISLHSSYVATRVRSPLSTIVETLVILPIAVPGIVVAVSYFYFFSKLLPGTAMDPTDPLSFNPMLLLVLSYSMRRLPFAARSIYAGMQQIHSSLEEASINLGASKWRTLLGITVPLVSLNILGGALLSFVYSMSETSTSITLGAINMERAPITAYMKDVMLSATGSVHLAAALGVLLILTQISAILVVNYFTKERFSLVGVT